MAGGLPASSDLSARSWGGKTWSSNVMDSFNIHTFEGRLCSRVIQKKKKEADY